MMKPLNLKLTCLAALLLSGAIQAQAINPIQAYEKALIQDATIRSSRAALEAGQERLPQAKSQLLPSIGINLGRTKNNLTTTGPNAFNQPFESKSIYYSHNKTLTVRQSILNLSRYHNYKQAQDLVDEAQANHDREIQSLVVRVGSAYIDALLALEQKELVSAQKQFYAALTDAAKKTFAAGTGTRTDIEDAQARLDLAIATELEVQQNVDYTRRQIEIMLNEPVPELARLNLESLATLPTSLPALEQWEEWALVHSPEVRAVQARLQAADKEISASRAGHAPTLEAQAQWADSSSENVSRIDSRFLNKSIGLQLVVPLYQGGATSSQVRQAVAEKTRTQEQLEALQRDLKLRLNKEYRGVTEGVLRIRAFEQAERSAAQLLISTERSQKAGVRTQLDILNVRQQLAQASRELANARFNYLSSRLRLNALAGKDPKDNIREISAAFTMR
jgi:outer membrane protein, protease secretion system